MQDTWTRRHNFIHLDIETATQMVQPAFPQQDVVSIEPLSGGLINTNYKIKVAGQDEACVLRIYTRDRETCRKEVDIFQLIHGRVPMPEVLYADTEGIGYELPYMVTRWVEGVMLKDVLATGSPEDVGEAAFAVGAVLARIASYRFERTGFFGHGLVVETPLPNAADYIEMCLQGKAGERLGREATERLRQLVRENAGLMAEVQQDTSLVHTDFQASNILMRHEDNDWKVAAVLDWEWAHAGTPLFDIAILLRHERQLPPRFAPQLINGFVQGGGRLPHEWKRLSKLLDLVNLCEFLSSAQQRGTMVDDVKGWVMETIEHWDSY